MPGALGLAIGEFGDMKMLKAWVTAGRALSNVLIPDHVQANFHLEHQRVRMTIAS